MGIQDWNSENREKRRERPVSSKDPAWKIARIRERAYQIWERKGRPQNSHLQDWVEAEQELVRGQVR
ncbi:MAG: DUF2934 domain-containing protein [Candidatus Omnitrophica bacterium]|nr:DUF2934 domain-containing protein [Candidatus Omnitrophota bacterium]